MSLAAIDNRLAVHPYYGSTIPPYLRNTDQVSSPRPACRAAGPGPFFYSPGCDRACCYRSLPRRHRPGRRASARRAGGPPRAAPPEHRHRRGDRAARCGRRPGRAPGRRAGSPGRHLASAITPRPFLACSGRPAVWMFTSAQGGNANQKPGSLPRSRSRVLEPGPAPVGRAS